MFLVLNLVVFIVFISAFVWVIVDPNKLVVPKHYSTSAFVFNLITIFLIVWFLLVGIFYSISGLFTSMKVLFS